LLDAAHVSPFSQSADHSPDNGILLRTDIHTLFDLGLVWIDPGDFTVRMDKALIDSEYYIYNDKKIRLPENTLYWPNQKRLKEKVAAKQKA